MIIIKKTAYTFMIEKGLSDKIQLFNIYTATDDGKLTISDFINEAIKVKLRTKTKGKTNV
jgi:hypothetical protein